MISLLGYLELWGFWCRPCGACLFPAIPRSHEPRQLLDSVLPRCRVHLIRDDRFSLQSDYQLCNHYPGP